MTENIHLFYLFIFFFTTNQNCNFKLSHFHTAAVLTTVNLPTELCECCMLAKTGNEKGENIPNRELLVVCTCVCVFRPKCNFEFLRKFLNQEVLSG